MKRITEQEVLKRLIDKNIKLIGEYKNNRIPTEFECTKCNYKWFTQSDHIFNNHGCPKCAGRLKLSNQIIDERLKSNIKRLGNFLPSYKGNKNKIEFECLDCKYKWFGFPNDYISYKKCGCPKCKNVAKLTNESLDSRLPKYIKRIDEYINSYTKIKFLCIICNNDFNAPPTCILTGKWGCPYCKLNKWEKLINDLLVENKIKFKRNFRVIIENRNYYIDFFLEDFNIAIEYNGRQHYYPINHYGGNEKFISQQKRDITIRHYCISNNINLMEYKYTLGYEKLKNEIIILINSFL